ncbi:hypothetical protein [Gemmatimonas groenlandica]|uniref:VanZ-like domain-containing protein n=1 Tax=Gemmatimonas groenlandica TaxID=2732249 RepID=A0A6M4IVL1_9BACT|nr:hypothetical protein [Gemmatimonas groenlandica]QJR37647.1 hypothetical protein HKW67_20045 [Gemmatimonas groenlandica]
MTFSTRYALVGISALAVLSLVSWARRVRFSGAESVMYLMGVLPNVAAAIAIPFILLGIWADQQPNASYDRTRRAFVVVLVGTGVLLVAWEFVQLTSRGLVFDPHDLVATCIGLGLAGILFTLVTPRGTHAA